MEEDPLADAVVVNVGEGNVRAGMAGFDEPNFRRTTAQLLAALGSPSPSSSPSAVPQPQPPPWSRSWGEWEDAVSAAAVGTLETQKRGSSVGWDATREAVDAGLPLLAGRPLLLARPSGVAMCAPDRVCQLIFEQFEAVAYYEAPCSVLSLYASGRTTGLVVDCGYASSTVHFVWDGLVHGLRPTITVSGGAALSGHLLGLLSRNHPQLNLTLDDANLIKEHAGRVSMHYAREVDQFERQRNQTLLLDSLHEREGESYLALLPAEIIACINQHAQPLAPLAQVKYTLPDGRSLVLDEEQIKCTEPLFRPSLLSHHLQATASSDPRTAPHQHVVAEAIGQAEEDKDGLGALARAVIENGPRKVRNEVSENVVLTGGTSMFPGLAKRLERELADHTQTTTGADQQRQQRVVKVVDLAHLSHRGDQAWIGGSILASLSSWRVYWATRDQYLEHGPSAVRRSLV